VNEYLLLFNKAFGKKLKPADIAGSDPITTRIARHLGQDRYDHGVPADLFLRERDKYLEQLSSARLNVFRLCFRRLMRPYLSDSTKGNPFIHQRVGMFLLDHSSRHFSFLH